MLAVVIDCHPRAGSAEHFASLLEHVLIYMNAFWMLSSGNRCIMHARTQHSVPTHLRAVPIYPCAIGTSEERSAVDRPHLGSPSSAAIQPRHACSGHQRLQLRRQQRLHSRSICARRFSPAWSSSPAAPWASLKAPAPPQPRRGPAPTQHAEAHGSLQRSRKHSAAFSVRDASYRTCSRAYSCCSSRPMTQRSTCTWP